MSTDQELDQNYVMPSVEHGAVVAWYPNGMPSDRPEVGYVVRVQHRGLNLTVPGRGLKTIVRHVTDPKLKLNNDQRENGAWDLTAAEKQRLQEMADLQDRVEALEARLAKITAARAAPKRIGLSGYDLLYRRAKDAGIRFNGRPSKTWLERKLAEQETSQLVPVGAVPAEAATE